MPSFDTDILAGKSAADDFWVESVIVQLGGGELSDVIITLHIWPMLGEHALAEFVALAECDGLESSAFKAEAECTDAAKKIQNTHLDPQPPHFHVRERITLQRGIEETDVLS